jgi:hypothetical protein
VSGPRWLTHALFAPHVGDFFEASPLGSEDHGVTLVLSDTWESQEAGGRGPGGERRQQFSLFFSGPVDAMLPQGTYALRHPELGDLDVFLVPLGPRDGAVRYEAAFA